MDDDTAAIAAIRERIAGGWYESISNTTMRSARCVTGM